MQDQMERRKTNKRLRITKLMILQQTINSFNLNCPLSVLLLLRWFQHAQKHSIMNSISKGLSRTTFNFSADRQSWHCMCELQKLFTHMLERYELGNKPFAPKPHEVKYFDNTSYTQLLGASLLQDFKTLYVESNIYFDEEHPGIPIGMHMVRSLVMTKNQNSFPLAKRLDRVIVVTIA